MPWTFVLLLSTGFIGATFGLPYAQAGDLPAAALRVRARADAPHRARAARAIAWLVLVLSIGAISLLTLLIRRGAATKVASLFYLVPPFTAMIAYLMFDEHLSPIGIAGFAVAVIGVALVLRS